MKLLLIGCGRIAKTHLEALSQPNSHIHVSGVCDVDPTRAKTLGEEYKVPYYTDYQEAIQHCDCEIVDICVWSGDHAKVALFASRHGKHVIVEKPMALTLSDADAMIREAELNTTKLYVIKQNRLNEPILLVKKALDEGRFGKIYHINAIVNWYRPQSYYDQDTWRGTWDYDGGAFMNQASHYIDMMRYFGGEVKTVFAQTATLARNIQAEDCGNAIMEFASGALGNIAVTMLAFQEIKKDQLQLLEKNEW